MSCIAFFLSALYFLSTPRLVSIGLAMSKVWFDADDLPNKTDLQSTKRNIQKHFSQQGLYLDLQRIKSMDEIPQDHLLRKIMQQRCGTGTIYVWVPIRVRLPIQGEWTYEYCWSAI